MELNRSVLKNEEKAIFDLRALYSLYGYSQYKMSKFEAYDLYVRNKDYLVSDNIITFTDTDGKLLALKPDVTLSIIKNGKDVPGTVQKVLMKTYIVFPRKTMRFRKLCRWAWSASAPWMIIASLKL